MDKNLRTIRLIVGDKEFTYPDFTIYFRVNFDEDEDANDARIEVYNLSSDSANRIKQGQPVVLSAGYEGDAGTIFMGVVDGVSIDRQQADKITTIEATDRELFKGVNINKTYKEGIKASQIIADIIQETGFEIKLKGRVYQIEVHYNAEGDYFTIDLYKNNKMIALGEKIVYDRSLFETYRDNRFPQVKIIPYDKNRKKDRVGYDELGEDVFLYVEELDNG